MFEAWKGKAIYLCSQCRLSFYADRLKCFTVTPSWIFWDGSFSLYSVAVASFETEENVPHSPAFQADPLFCLIKKGKNSETWTLGKWRKNHNAIVYDFSCMMWPGAQETANKKPYLFLLGPASFTRREGRQKAEDMPVHSLLAGLGWEGKGRNHLFLPCCP